MINQLVPQISVLIRKGEFLEMLLKYNRQKYDPGKLHLIGFQIHGIRMRRVRLYLIYNSAISVLITLSRISDVFSVKYSNPYRPLISEMKKIASFVQDNSYKRCSENSSILTCIHELRRVGYLIYVYNTLGHLGLGSIFFIPEFLIWTQMEACGVGQFCNTIVNPLVLFFDKSLILGCLWPLVFVLNNTLILGIWCSTIPHLPGCFCPWAFFENIGFNTVLTDPFMSHLAI